MWGDSIRTDSTWLSNQILAEITGACYLQSLTKEYLIMVYNNVWLIIHDLWIPVMCLLHFKAHVWHAVTELIVSEIYSSTGFTNTGLIKSEYIYLNIIKYELPWAHKGFSISKGILISKVTVLVKDSGEDFVHEEAPASGYREPRPPF